MGFNSCFFNIALKLPLLDNCSCIVLLPGTPDRSILGHMLTPFTGTPDRSIHLGNPNPHPQERELIVRVAPSPRWGEGWDEGYY